MAATRKKAAGRRGSGAVTPRDVLLPYQRAWSDDRGRWKIGLMARQTGKDFSSGDEGVRDIFDHELAGDKTTWLIAAPSERQSLESLEKWKEWTAAYEMSIADLIEEREGGSEALLKSSTIVYPRGSRVIAVPGRPETVRGFSANVLLTEFAFFEDQDRTWRAILPSITNPLRGGEKKVRIISTPNGQGDRFHTIWSKNHGLAGGKWSTHRVTIWDAVRQGLPLDPEEIREALDDPEGWAQEYECEFLDSAAVLLGYDLIAACEGPEAGETVAPEYWAVAPAFPRVMGIDFGRKKNLTVGWTAEVIGGLRVTREVLVLQGMPTPAQVEILGPRVLGCVRTCLDYTGPGVGLGDYLVERYGEYAPGQHRFGRVELCTFSAGFKQEVFPKLRMAFERRDWRVPVSRQIREDLHSMYRVTTRQGTVTYRAPHTEDGHADRCTALALCERAAGQLGRGAITDPAVIRRPQPVFMPARLRRTSRL